MQQILVAWLGLHVFINILIPLYFIHTLEAKVVLIAIICSMTIMMAIFSAKGFVRQPLRVLAICNHYPEQLLFDHRRH